MITVFSFRLVFKAECLSEQQTEKTLIRLLLKKQSDLGLHCLSRPFWQTTSVGVCLFVFVALRPKSTAMVIAGRSVHLTTLFPGQA